MTFIKPRLFKNFAFYTVFAFLNKGMAFLLTPFFTRYLTPEEYGIYALFFAATLICEPFLSLGVDCATWNVYFNPSEYPIREYVSTFLFFCAGMFTAQVVFLGSLWLFLSNIFNFSAWMLLVPLVALSNLIQGILLGMWIVKETPVPYGRFSFCYLLAQLLLQVTATVFFKLGWRGVLGAQGVLAAVIIPVTLVLLRKNKWLGFCFNKNCLRFGLKFGLGFMPNMLFARLNDLIGRLFVSRMFSLAETGIYSAGQKLGGIMNIYNQSFVNTYQPWLLKKLSGNVRRDKRKIILSVAVALASMAVFALGGSSLMYLFSGFILGENFQRSAIFVFWSASAYALNGMYNVVSLFIYQTGKSWIQSLLTMTAVGLNSLFTWYFLGVYGLIGAAYAPVLAWTAALALAVVVVIKLMKKGQWERREQPLDFW